MTRGLAALAAVALTVWACTVSTRTDKLACTTTDDCGSGRICQSGYCVVGTIDAATDGPPSCPSACASCDVASATCNVTGSGAPITCPAGWNCAITCTDAAPCGDISCGSYDCTVTCTGAGACAKLTCGTGRCTQDCEGSGACGETMCASSCRCDVTCNPLQGACGTMTCPFRGNRNCTKNMIPGAECDSSIVGACHTCQ